MKQKRKGNTAGPLRPCILRIPVMAVRITKENLSTLRELDKGDGALDFDDEENLVGCWYVVDRSGAQVMPEDADIHNLDAAVEKKREELP